MKRRLNSIDVQHNEYSLIRDKSIQVLQRHLRYIHSSRTRLLQMTEGLQGNQVYHSWEKLHPKLSFKRQFLSFGKLVKALVHFFIVINMYYPGIHR